MALFLVKASYPHKLANAPGGTAYLNDPPATLRQGKLVFADNCAACHSSKAPDRPAGADPGACIGPHYLDCWNRTGHGPGPTITAKRCAQIVLADDFLDGNYLSNDVRVPVTLLQTNACSPLATNAIGGNIWDNFSSASYKSLPSVGSITVYDPFTGKPQQLPDAGRRARLYPGAVADQPVGDRALSAQQQRRQVRPEPIGRGAAGARSRTRSPKCCGRTSAPRTRCSATRCRG